jgi:hypothetical protein
MTSQTLRECPFCGHAVTVNRGWTVEDPITIRCAGCGLVLKSQWRYPDMSGTRVITGWNTRHADTELAALRAELITRSACPCDELRMLRMLLAAYREGGSACGLLAAENIRLLRELAPLRALKEAMRRATANQYIPTYELIKVCRDALAACDEAAR